MDPFDGPHAVLFRCGYVVVAAFWWPIMCLGHDNQSAAFWLAVFWPITVPAMIAWTVGHRVALFLSRE